MLRSLVALCLRQRFVVLALASVCIVLGVRVASNAPLDAFPEFAPPRIEIQTEAPGLSTEQVEARITTELESVLAGTPGMSSMRSKSVLGLSSVLLLLERDADLMATRMLVGERIARAKLPTVAKTPVVLSPLSSTSRALKIAVYSDSLSQMELTDLVRWTVRPRLMRVPDVANVAIWGEQNRQLQVQIDPEQLQAEGISVDRVVEAARSATSPSAGGFVDGPNQRLAVLHPPYIKDIKDLAAVPVAPSSMRSVAIGDVAEVIEDHASAIGDAVVTKGSGLLLIVEKQIGGNTLEVTYGIDAALRELKPALPGVTFDATIFRPAGFIERALSNLREAMIIGSVLVVLILFFFLWDVRTALISVLAIPLSLLAAATVLTLSGHTLDTMVIAGLIIALGEVVDDAIIDVENIHRRLRQAQTQRSFAETIKIVLNASLEVRSAVVYATLIVLLVFIPVLALPGVAGEFFRPLALAYALAVLASMIVALTITPVLALLLLPNHVNEERQAPLMHLIGPAYGRFLQKIINRPRLAMGGALFAVVLCLASFASFSESFLPHFAENDFLMHWIGKPGSSLETMHRSATRVRDELLSVPGVRNFGAHIGRAEVADEVVGPNFAELWISVDPNADLDKTLTAVRNVVDGYPGIYRDVQTYLQERMREVLSGGSGAIVIRLFGSDLEKLRSMGADLSTKLGAIKGVSHASADAQLSVPEIEIVPNLEACNALGIDPGLVLRRASLVVQGEKVGQIVRGQQPIDIVIWSSPRAREDINAVRNMLISIDEQRSMRLGDVASVQVGSMPNTIVHESGSRKIDVTLQLDEDADLGGISREVSRVTKAFPMPKGHHAEILGEYQARSSAQRRLLVVGTMALLGIFIVLLADFRSLRLSLLVFASLPLALVGGVLITALSGGVVSLGSLVGFITVLGIAARNGILLISHFHHLEHEEGMAFGPELVIRGAKERLAPILMTALSTALALLPLIIAGSSAGHEIEHPMAIVILGGLISSTLLNLAAMPVVYLHFGRTPLTTKVSISSEQMKLHKR
ncbi:MAG: efflux RND transporter permease subunit [Myxococcales bacterium]|nr:MAG: efflux RND transporter permease subunit [Myxococcales bacterium]